METQIPHPKHEATARTRSAPTKSSWSSASRPGASSNAVEFDPKLLWVTVRRCWMWATPIGLALAAIAAFVVYAQFVPIYRATHLMEANQDYVVFKGVMPNSRNLAASEKQLIYTDLVLDAVLSDPQVQGVVDTSNLEDLKYGMKKKISVGNAGSNALLTVSFQHADPQVAALLCNKITEAYLVQRERFDNERVTNLESWLAPSIDLWKNEVEQHEKRVRELSKVTLGFDPTQRVEGLENDLSILGGLRRNLADFVVEESILEAKVAMGEAGVRQDSVDPSSLPEIQILPPTTIEIQQFVSADPAVQKARQRLASLEAKVLSLEDRGMTGVRQDYYKELKVDVEQQRSEVAAAEKVAQEQAPEMLRRRAVELAQRRRVLQGVEQRLASEEGLESQKKQLKELRSKKAIIQNEYDIERARLEQQGGNAADLRFAQEDREVAVGILGQLNHRLASIRTERRRGTGVHTLAAATPPTRPIEPMPTKKMVVMGGGAFVIPFLLGLLWEFRTQRISDASTLETKNLAPVVGEVSRLPSKVGGGKRQRVFEESIDTLRANLMLSKDTQGVRTITVASSMSGEGKSSVSSQLAISLAKACGKTVLLVDADLRSPDQHDIFGLEMGPGLSKVLSGEATFDDAVNRSLGDLVHVLPAGHMTMSPHRLLNASALRDLFDQALDQYSYVVVDTAPVLAAGETLAIAA